MQSGPDAWFVNLTLPKFCSPPIQTSSSHQKTHGFGLNVSLPLQLCGSVCVVETTRLLVFKTPTSFESRFQFLFTCSCQFSISCRASALVACTTSSRRPLEKVYRLLRSSILGLLKSGRECLHHPPKSSYPDLPSPKDWEQTPACSINLSGAEPIGFHFRTNLITHGFIALLYRQI